MAKEPKTVTDIHLEMNEAADKETRNRVRLMNEKEVTIEDIKKNGLPENFKKLKGKQVQTRINVGVESHIVEDLKTINELMGRSKSEFYKTVEEAASAYIRRYKLNRVEIQAKLDKIKELKSDLRDILSEDFEE